MSSIQKHIINELGVKESIIPQEEVRRRVDFIKEYISTYNFKGAVLSISGGQDSLLAGKLAQRAVEEMRSEGNQVMYVAVRLPYGVQADECDAQLALEYIEPDKIIHINIKKAVDASVEAFNSGTGEKITDFLKGNIKARERMKVHYDLAGFYNLVVLGTDHAAEALTGFYTKYGDGGADILPLSGLNKRQGKEILRYLDAPEKLINKIPTADLLDDIPLRADEDELGITYDEIDDFLEGKAVSEEVMVKIEERYTRNFHKRELPAILK